MTTATIIVCTRDRADDLEVTCRSLLDLSANNPRVDILVIDNGSSDRTPNLLTHLSTASRERLRWLVEPRSGLSMARNAGVTASRGESLIFIDDDALPSQGWLEALLSSLDDPSVWAAGGPVEPSLSSDVPDWFSARFLPYLSAWDRGPEAESSVYNEYPRGTNMAFKRQVFSKLGSFLTQLGRRGGSLRSCEETEMFLRVERAGYEIRYEPGARVVHKVEVDRLSRSWMKRRFFAQGLSEAILEWRHGGFEALKIGVGRGLSAVRQFGAFSDSTSRLLKACQTSALRGYLAGSIFAPLTTPRMRVSESEQPLAAWLPPH